MVTPNPPGTIAPKPEWDKTTMSTEIARRPFKLGIVGELGSFDTRLRLTPSLPFMTRSRSVEWSHVPRGVANGDCEISGLSARPPCDRQQSSRQAATMPAVSGATRATGRAEDQGSGITAPLRRDAPGRRDEHSHFAALSTPPSVSDGLDHNLCAPRPIADRAREFTSAPASWRKRLPARSRRPASTGPRWARKAPEPRS